MSAPVDDETERRLRYAPGWARIAAAKAGAAAPDPKSAADTVSRSATKTATPSAAVRVAARLVRPVVSGAANDTRAEIEENALPAVVASRPAHGADAQTSRSRHDKLSELATLAVQPEPTETVRPTVADESEDLQPAQTSTTSAYAGDVAFHDLARRLSLDPRLVPEPPLPTPAYRWRLLPLVACLCTLVFASAAVLVLLSPPGGRTFFAVDPSPAPSAQAQQAAKIERELVSGLERSAPVRLVVGERRAVAVDEAVPLAVALTRAIGEGALVIEGLAQGARLAGARAIDGGRWSLSVADLPRAVIEPPRGFVGVMMLGIELRFADGTIADRGATRIDWGGATVALPPATGSLAPHAPTPWRSASLGRDVPAGTTLDAEELRVLLQRGESAIQHGDVAGARLLLRRAADGGDARAALLLGTTFDPAALRRRKVVGAVADPEAARVWYQRAAELGSPEARGRLEALVGAK